MILQRNLCFTAWLRLLGEAIVVGIVVGSGGVLLAQLFSLPVNPAVSGIMGGIAAGVYSAFRAPALRR